MALILINGKKLKPLSFMEFEEQEQEQDNLDLPLFEPIQDDKGE